MLNRLLKLGALLTALGLLIAGCGSDSTSTGTSTTAAAAAGGSTTTAKAGATTAEKLPALKLAGSGATFPGAFYEEVFAAFTKANPGVDVTYNPVGSGQGQTDLQGALVDFAGSDSLVKDADKTKFKSDFLYLPTVAAPITVSYNLKGVTKLQVSAPVLAKILQGQVTTWSDPAIAADNPGVTLPGTAITVVHRSDGSGTTSNFTAYLAAAAGADWTLGSGTTVNWPASTVGAEKNTGVADKIKATDGAIGYVDFSDAKATGLSFAAVKNADGKYITASLDAASAALKGATIKDDVTYNPLNAPGADAYPIVSPTYILVYAKYADANKVTDIKALLTYLLGPAQDMAADLDFAKLPQNVLDKAKTQIDKITVG